MVHRQGTVGAHIAMTLVGVVVLLVGLFAMALMGGVLPAVILGVGSALFLAGLIGISVGAAIKNALR